MTPHAGPRAARQAEHASPPRQREQADKLRAQHGVEARSWYRITNAASPDEAEVMLYDEIGGWWGATADEFIADLRGITAPNLRVRINSPGGSVFEGIAIANALRSHPGHRDRARSTESPPRSPQSSRWPRTGWRWPRRRC
jgi:hypothetical protein